MSFLKILSAIVLGVMKLEPAQAVMPARTPRGGSTSFSIGISFPAGSRLVASAAAATAPEDS